MENNIKTPNIILLFVLLTLILSGCKKEEEFPDYKIVYGYYEGTYTYQDNGYGCSILFEDKTFNEVYLNPSIIRKKDWWCLTAGTFSFAKDKLIFELDSLVYDFDPAEYQCNADCFLPGEYTITYLNTASDTLYFERGEGEHKIEYQLWRFD
jgi:hypothetical protein